MTGQEPFSVDVVRADDVWHVIVRGDLDAASRMHFERTVAELADTDVEVDLSQVGFLDSNGLRTLVWLRHRLAAAGHALRILGSSGQTRRIIEITGLCEVLGISRA